MAINFPDNPNPNDIHTDGGKSWIWDGTTWKIYSSSTSGIGLGDLSVNTSSVGTASLSYNQSTGVFTYTPPDLSSYITQQYTLPTASTTVLGGVKVDGSSINIDANGVISGASTYSLPTATTTVLGGVKIDGTSITINNGVITASSSSTTTNLNLTDESGDTECFPVFCGAPTNNQTPHTNSSFKFNSTSGELSAGSFKKIGGSSSEFLKADGSIDSTTYLSSNPSYTLNDLSNVDATTNLANGKILKYDLSTTSWVVADDGGGAGSGGGNVAVGSVMMWSGSVASIPTGWQLCDGTNGSPDLRDKFVIGAGNNYSVGATGGSATDTVNISGSDTVTISGSDTVNITISGTTGGATEGGGGYPSSGYNAHQHSFSGSGSDTVTITGSDTVNISGSDTVNTIPPYYALCYIYCTATGSNQTFIGLDDTPISHNNGKYLQSNGSALIWVDPPSGFSGNYNDLSNKPTLFSGSYNDLSNKPNLFDGTWSSLSGKPTLFSGSYTDLTNKPTLFDGTWSSLSGKPTIPSTLNDLTDVDATTGAAVGKILKYNGSSWELADDATGGVSQIQSDWNQSNSGSVDFIKNKPTLFSGSYNDLSNKPTLFSGSYNDLSNKPTIFSGSWNDLSDKPTLVTQLSQLSDVNFSGSPANDSILKWSSSTGQWVVGTQSGGFSGNYNDLSNKPTLFSGSWNDLSNKPTLFSGSWNDLSNKPTLFDGTWSSLSGKPTIPDADKIIEGNTSAEIVDGGSGYFKVVIDGTERFRVQNNGETILKRTNTSVEGGHLQFEDSDGVQSFAIDVYGTTTSNSRLRFIDQVTNTQRFAINRSGAFGVGQVDVEDYGSSGEVLISQGSSSQPIWGSVSSTVPVVESVIRTSDISTSSQSYQTAHVLTVNPNVSSSSLLIVAAGMMGSWRQDDYDDPEKNRCEAVLYRDSSIIGTSCVSSLADHSGDSGYTNTGFNLTVKDTNNHGGNNVTYYLKFRRYGTNDNGPVKIMKGTSLTVQELI